MCGGNFRQFRKPIAMPSDCARTRIPMPFSHNGTLHKKGSPSPLCNVPLCEMGIGFRVQAQEKNPSMNLTRKEAKVLGLAHLWPKKSKDTTRDGMNKHGWEFWEQL